MDSDTCPAGLLGERASSRPPMTPASDPARLGPGDLLAALGEQDCARAAQAYAALGYAVVPMHTAWPGGACGCPDPACPDAGKHPRLRGWRRLAAVDPAVAGEWWRRWRDAKHGLATGPRLDVLDLDGDQGMEALRAVLSIEPREHPGRWRAPAGEAGTCSTGRPESGIGSGCCPGWTGGAGVG
jgi:hypothetical protein